MRKALFQAAVPSKFPSSDEEGGNKSGRARSFHRKRQERKERAKGLKSNKSAKSSDEGESSPSPNRLGKLFGRKTAAAPKSTKGKETDEEDADQKSGDKKKEPASKKNKLANRLKIGKKADPKGKDTSGTGTDESGSSKQPTTDDEGGDPDDPDKGGEKAAGSDEDEDVVAKLSKNTGGSTVDESKKLNYQVRVHVVEAKELEGNNLHPYTRIFLGTKVRSTRTRRSTNNPEWNESLHFSIHSSLTSLLETRLQFKVCTSGRRNSSVIIGTHDLDLGMIYKMKKHCLECAWLVLSYPTDPKEKTDDLKIKEKSQADTTGYVKVWLCIVIPGEQAPIYVPGDPENEDTEVNMIYPASIQFSPITMLLRIYCGQDIPVLSGNIIKKLFRKLFGKKKDKELDDNDQVNPQMEITVAGKKVKTEPIMFNSHPDFYTEFRIPLNWPTVARDLIIRMFDFYRIGKNEPLGNFKMALNQIGKSGATGYLPTFGPTFVSLYGTTNARWAKKEINLGTQEGLEYHGRVLIEIKCYEEEEPLKKPQELQIGKDLALKIKPFFRCVSHVFYCAFVGGSMINETFAHSTVKLSVCCGMYGSRSQDSIPCVSETESIKPIYDGTNYWWIPWTNKKPCCVLPCEWESPLQRIEGANYFNNVLISFKDRLERIEMRVNTATQFQIASDIIFALDSLIISLRPDVPSVPYETVNCTELDLQLTLTRRLKRKDIMEQAHALRDQQIRVDVALELMHGFINQLEPLCTDPQLNEIPDIFIWMHVNDEKVSYIRLPAKDIFFSTTPEYRGKYCGRTQSIFMEWIGKRSSTFNAHPGQLHLKMWMGPSAYAKTWRHLLDGGEMGFFAEVYENQSRLMGGAWMTSKMPWSDHSGKNKLPSATAENSHKFALPSSLTWKGEWFMDSAHNMYFDEHIDFAIVTEEVYEMQPRDDSGYWDDINGLYTDEEGNPTTEPRGIQCPRGWQWLDDHWLVDYSGPVDSNGFEYSIDPNFRRFDATERGYHMYRRRRWVRKRGLKQDEQKMNHLERMHFDAEGWQYTNKKATKVERKEKFHLTERRRRWLRRMVERKDWDENLLTYDHLAIRINEIDTMLRAGKVDRDPEIPMVNRVVLPRTYIVFRHSYAWQLRAYIFQGRDIYNLRSNALCRPYCRVTFVNQSMETIVVPQPTMTPIWNQTLIFKNLYLPFLPDRLKAHPPSLIVELFDWSNFGIPKLIGQFSSEPLVRPDKDNMAAPAASAKLTWTPVKHKNVIKGEILAAFELFQADNYGYVPHAPIFSETTGKSKPRKVYEVPAGIRPIFDDVWVEFLCWGVRHLKKYKLLAIKSPFVEVHCGKLCKRTARIVDATLNPNFANPVMIFETSMPLDSDYATPLTLCLHDNRSFGRTPIVGVCVIKDLHKYIKLEPTDFQQLRSFDHIDVTALKSQLKLLDADADVDTSNLDWWSKFYASIGDTEKSQGFLDKGFQVLEIFESEAEKIAPFNGFADFCDTFAFQEYERFPWQRKDRKVIGELKGRLMIYRNPSDNLKTRKHTFNLKYLKPESCTVRVYCVRGISLSSQNRRGTADPYIKVKCGSQTKSERKNYVAKSLDPLFGQMVELDVTLPHDKDLIVQVWDHNVLSVDDLIGETTIDLENRLMTCWRATCGVQRQFFTSGPYIWRDQQSPKRILVDYCLQTSFPEPIFVNDTTIKLGNHTFALSQFEEADIIKKNTNFGDSSERLANYVLQILRVVPEHVETRSLYLKTDQETEQGKLQMWVDVFPASVGELQPPIDIELRKPQAFQLRLVIWKSTDVVMEKMSVGEWSADIYVKAWINGQKEIQKTDVHYRSLDGTGSFNWRFVFNFDYIPAERSIVVKTKDKFWYLSKKSTEYFKPELIVEVWDNRKFGRDRFIGQYRFNMTNFEEPCEEDHPMYNVQNTGKFVNMKKKMSKVMCKCCMGGDAKRPKLFYNPTTDPAKLQSMFEITSDRGWWPMLRFDEDKQTEVTGKVEMEYAVLPKDIAEEEPAGKGRAAPNQNPELPKPDRPFLDKFWLTSRIKAFCRYIWRRHKWTIIFGILIIFLIISFIFFLVKVPEILIQEAIRRS